MIKKFKYFWGYILILFLIIFTFNIFISKYGYKKKCIIENNQWPCIVYEVDDFDLLNRSLYNLNSENKPIQSYFDLVKHNLTLRRSNTDFDKSLDLLLKEYYLYIYILENNFKDQGVDFIEKSLLNINWNLIIFFCFTAFIFFIFFWFYSNEKSSLSNDVKKQSNEFGLYLTVLLFLYFLFYVLVFWQKMEIGNVINLIATGGLLLGLWKFIPSYYNSL
jgi:hypothetical protein